MRAKVPSPKSVFFSVMVLVVVAGLASAYWFLVRQNSDSGSITTDTNTKNSARQGSNDGSGAETNTDQYPNRIRILGAGDFLAHDSINANAKQPDGSYEYLPMMNEFTDVLKAADVRFCNDGNLNGGEEFGISGYPKFNSPKEFARDMVRVGCNVVNTGTNHSFDRNQAAINATVDAWDALEGTLAVAGSNRNQAEHDEVHYFTVKGVKFAFLAYTTYINIGTPAQNDYGVNVYSDAYASRQIKEAKANGAQFILTSIRWGTEYSQDVNSEQRRIAQYLADQGVDLIFGHGPHVLETVDQLTGKSGNTTTVWYSIGNFLNTQLEPETLFNGVAVVDIDATTLEVTSMSFLPFYMHYKWSASDAASESLLARYDIKMYHLEDATQSLVDAQQLNTTIEAEKSRIQSKLNENLSIIFHSKDSYFE